MTDRRSPPSDEPPQASSRKAAENREFVAEAEEILERLFEDLSALHEARADGGEVDPEVVNRLFRSAHSLKGLAGMFGHDAIGQLAHRFEDVLDRLRLGRMSFESPALDLLDEGVSVLAGLMTRLERGEPLADEVARARTFNEQIDRVLAPVVEATTIELTDLDLDPGILRALTEYEEHRLREGLRRGRHVSLVDAMFEIRTFEEGLGALSVAVREVGEVVSTLPSPGAAPESQICFSLLVATDIDADQLRDRLADTVTAVRCIERGTVAANSATPPPPPVSTLVPPATPDRRAPRSEDGDAVAAASESETEVPLPSPPPEASKPVPESVPELESLRSISDTVRVDIRKLDELMNLVGELVIQRSAVGQLAGRLIEEPATARAGMELRKTVKKLDRKLKELQVGVLDVRMVPLRQIFERLARVGRRLRRDLNKEAEIEFSGAETELDKLIAEQLIDPLVHLVRNAFDHALEPAEDRAALGKPAQGRICVSAFQRGNHVVIEIEDDGRGLNVDAIRAKALSSGLISEAEASPGAMPEKEILNLVFEAGLSTAEEVSETSGRGVGMDVVRANLAEMGGVIDLSSTAGQGTVVTMTLPITLAIIQALIVGVGDERFAIPLNSVLETLIVEPDQVGDSEGREIMNLRGEPILLQRLGHEFEIDLTNSPERQFVVVLGIGEQRLGLLVDRLEGQQDAVIKPIKGPLLQVRGIAGATELGDQGTVLVIDVSALVSDATRRRDAA